MRRSRNPAGSSSGLRATWTLSTNTPKSRVEIAFGRRLGSLSFSSMRWTERARPPVRVCANKSRSVSQRPRGTSTNRTGDSAKAPRRTGLVDRGGGPGGALRIAQPEHELGHVRRGYIAHAKALLVQEAVVPRQAITVAFERGRGALGRGFPVEELLDLGDKLKSVINKVEEAASIRDIGRDHLGSTHGYSPKHSCPSTRLS